MIKVACPRIMNLGDFSHCLPVLSGLYKKHQVKMSFELCNRLERFNGLVDLLMAQDMFSDVSFKDNFQLNDYNIIIDDTAASEHNLGNEPIEVRRIYNYIKDKQNIDFGIDLDFELVVPEMNIPIDSNKILLGDRWTTKDAIDVDNRRTMAILKDSGKFNDDKYVYLDYTKPLLHNVYLIKHNPNVFITTFTGISVLAELMKKDNIIVCDDDYSKFIYDNCQGRDHNHGVRLHYFTDRNSKLIHVNELGME